MTAASSSAWLDANQRYLVAALQRVRQALVRHAAQLAGDPATAIADSPAEPPVGNPESFTVETLCKGFGLSAFERDIILLCAGCELAAGFGADCAAAQGSSQRPYATFALALAALPGAHFSAVAPSGPLRRFRLIEMQASETLTQSPLRLNERVLHYLTGLSYLDESLQGLAVPVPVPPALPPSQLQVAERIAAVFASTPANQRLPLIHLCGPDPSGQYLIAAAACADHGLGLHRWHAAQLPSDAAERETLVRLWARESVLLQSGLLILCDDTMNSESIRTALWFCERLDGVVLLAGPTPVSAPGQALLRIDVGPPTAAEQHTLWQELLAPLRESFPEPLDQHLERLVGHFSLGLSAMQTACAMLQERLAVPPTDAVQSTPEAVLWDVCRTLARPQLGDLAQRIETAARWDDLILPEGQLAVLREVAVHLRQRQRVYGTWGFDQKGLRGLGISALFSGASGTGKTLAAEVLAAELQLDLYRIDLSQVASKYIGETEKSLRRVFDAAEQAGAILLFDEADALFGKRSDVKDSHDRYANLEVSYLLQRMETYRGLAILTSNLKSALDSAFLRRIRFVVHFSFPDPTQRQELWRRVFPAATPKGPLDYARLSRLNVAGGNIRNIALSAAFLAADEAQPVQMAHILRAVRGEYAKLEKTLPDAEISGWI